jgi:two-component system NtrC family sensor kinase
MTRLLHRSYAEIEGRPLNLLMTNALKFSLPGDADARTMEISVDRRSFRLSIEPILLDDVRTGSIFVVADTTLQKQAEHAALLNERLAATGRMAHTIAHEINNPLQPSQTFFICFVVQSPVRPKGLST